MVTPKLISNIVFAYAKQNVGFLTKRLNSFYNLVNNGSKLIYKQIKNTLKNVIFKVSQKGGSLVSYG